ncbi:MAG TPA: alpha-ketoglutarate-dependent dioxygenase AlkB [Chitinophagaceae bacterium]|nr:alpha-ketoglutarate-dependent dioxygenase AlkB [Chitinophagaceae bacterium]
MNTLFPLEPIFPPGFNYLPDFISEEEEAQLINAIFKIELHPFQFQGYEAKRKVASFGYDWNFDMKSLAKGKMIPEAFHPLIEKISKHLLINKDDVAELLVTEYTVGSVINWHRDAPPFDLIAGISLLSHSVFRLRPFNKEKQTRSSVISFPLKSRSLYIMQGASRTDWQHSIAAVDKVRYSITLRTLKA